MYNICSILITVIVLKHNEIHTHLNNLFFFFNFSSLSLFLSLSYFRHSSFKYQLFLEPIFDASSGLLFFFFFVLLHFFLLLLMIQMQVNHVRNVVDDVNEESE